MLLSFRNKVVLRHLINNKGLAWVFSSGTNTETHLFLRAVIKIYLMCIEHRGNWDKGQGITDLLGGKGLAHIILIWSQIVKEYASVSVRFTVFMIAEWHSFAISVYHLWLPTGVLNLPIFFTPPSILAKASTVPLLLKKNLQNLQLLSLQLNHCHSPLPFPAHSTL